MITALHHKQTTLAYKALCSFIALTFLTSVILPPQIASAQFSPTTVLNLPVPGTMVPPSSGFAPALMTGITIHPDNPLRFDFIMDRGQSDLAGEPLKEEYTKIIKYFMASLTVPEDELWVNLSPYEKDRMVAEGLGKTEMGRDMLAQDYLLKQLTASLMYPEKELGKEFWARIYKKAKEQFGTTEIPVNTFNKVWIVPDDALVYEQGTSAFVIKSRLKVMLESDYDALRSNAESRADFGLNGAARDEARMESKSLVSGNQTKETRDDFNSPEVTQVIREVVIPAIEVEVNEGKNFANLRQIYNALILATWYKERLKDSLLSKVYVDQNKTKGIDTEDKEVNQKIYDQYIESFKKGVYNFIKEDVDPATQEIIPRKYFSGGLEIKWKLGTKILGYVLMGTALVFGTPDGSLARQSAQDVQPIIVAQMQAQEKRPLDDVVAELVEGAQPEDVGTAAITVREGAVQPILLAQAGKEPLGKKEAEIEKDDVLSNLKKLANIDNPDKARQNPAFEAILVLWSKAEPALVTVIKEEQVFGMNELKYALLLLGMVGTPNDENERLLRSFIKQDYKGNMGPPAIEAVHGLEILLRRRAQEQTNLREGDSKAHPPSKIDASFWQYPDDPMVQTVEAQPDGQIIQWSWHNNQPWVGWGLKVLMDPEARKKIAEKDTNGLFLIIPYRPGGGDITIIFEDNSRVKKAGDNWVGNEVRMSEGELLKRAQQKGGYLIVSLQKIPEIIPVVFSLKQIKFEAVSREGTASIGQPLITGKNPAEITDIDTLYKVLIKAELEPGKPSSQLITASQELWTPNMSWAGSDGFGQHFVIADLPELVSTGHGQVLEFTYTSQSPNNLGLYIFDPNAPEGFKADLEGAAGTEKTVYVALPPGFHYQRVVLTGKDPGLAGISWKPAGESASSSPITAVKKLFMGVLLSVCAAGCSIGVQYRMDTPAFRQAMTSANETDLNQLLQQIRKTHKGFNFYASVTDAGLRQAVETFRKDENKVGFLGDKEFIEALSLLDNLSPETLKAVIPLIVNTQERLDPYLWAGKELARLTDDRRLAELASVSTVVKLLVQEGDLIVSSKTVVEYRWTQENELKRYEDYYKDHTEVKHPAPRWNDADIPRLEKLSKGPYPYYQKAAEKALEKIKRGDLQVSPASSPVAPELDFSHEETANLIEFIPQLLKTMSKRETAMFNWDYSVPEEVSPRQVAKWGVVIWRGDSRFGYPKFFSLLMKIARQYRTDLALVVNKKRVTVEVGFSYLGDSSREKDSNNEFFEGILNDLTKWFPEQQLVLEQKYPDLAFDFWGSKDITRRKNLIDWAVTILKTRSATNPEYISAQRQLDSVLAQIKDEIMIIENGPESAQVRSGGYLARPEKQERAISVEKIDQLLQSIKDGRIELEGRYVGVLQGNTIIEAPLLDLRIARDLGYNYYPEIMPLKEGQAQAKASRVNDKILAFRKWAEKLADELQGKPLDRTQAQVAIEQGVSTAEVNTTFRKLWIKTTGKNTSASPQGSSGEGVSSPIRLPESLSKRIVSAGLAATWGICFSGCGKDTVVVQPPQSQEGSTDTPAVPENPIDITVSSEQLIAVVKDGNADWSDRSAAAQEIFVRGDEQGMAIVLAELVWPNINALNIIDPIQSSRIEVNVQRLKALGWKVVGKSVIENLQSADANANTRTWSIRLISEFASFDEGFPALVAVFENKDGSYTGQHDLESQFALFNIFTRYASVIVQYLAYQGNTDQSVNDKVQLAASRAALLLDVETKTPEQLIAIVEDLNAVWLNRVVAAQALFARGDAQGMEAVRTALVWPNINALNLPVSGYEYEGRTQIFYDRLKDLGWQIIGESVIENLKDPEANFNTHSWSIRFINESASLQEGLPALVTVFENTAGIYSEGQVLDARFTLFTIFLRQDIPTVTPYLTYEENANESVNKKIRDAAEMALSYMEPGPASSPVKGAEIVYALQRFFDTEINRNSQNAGRVDPLTLSVVDFGISLTDDELTATDGRHARGYSLEVTDDGERKSYLYKINPNQDGFDINVLLRQIQQDLEPTLTSLWKQADFYSYLGDRWENVVGRVRYLYGEIKTGDSARSGEGTASPPVAAISTDEMKEKLNNLEQYMPEAGDVLYQFGEFLSSRLNPELVPIGFIMAANLAIYDLEKGVDGVTNEALSNKLPGYYGPEIYELKAPFIGSALPSIAEAVCPKEFAQEVKTLWDEIQSASSPVTLGQLRQELIGIRDRFEMANPERFTTLAKFDVLIKVIDNALENEKGIAFQKIRGPLYDLFYDLPKYNFSDLGSEIEQYIGGLELGGEGQISHFKIGALIDASIRELNQSEEEKVQFRDLLLQYLNWLGGFIAEDTALTFGNFHRFVKVVEMINPSINDVPAVQKLVQAIYELQFGGFRTSPTPPAASPVRMIDVREKLGGGGNRDMVTVPFNFDIWLGAGQFKYKVWKDADNGKVFFQRFHLSNEEASSQKHEIVIGEAFSVGRDPQNNSYSLADPSLSRSHFRIIVNDKRSSMTIEDRGSTNGTDIEITRMERKLDGKEIEEFLKKKEQSRDGIYIIDRKELFRPLLTMLAHDVDEVASLLKDDKVEVVELDGLDIQVAWKEQGFAASPIVPIDDSSASLRELYGKEFRLKLSQKAEILRSEEGTSFVVFPFANLSPETQNSLDKLFASMLPRGEYGLAAIGDDLDSMQPIGLVKTTLMAPEDISDLGSRMIVQEELLRGRQSGRLGEGYDRLIQAVEYYRFSPAREDAIWENFVSAVLSALGPGVLSIEIRLMVPSTKIILNKLSNEFILKTPDVPDPQIRANENISLALPEEYESLLPQNIRIDALGQSYFFNQRDLTKYLTVVTSRNKDIYKNNRFRYLYLLKVYKKGILAPIIGEVSHFSGEEVVLTSSNNIVISIPLKDIDFTRKNEGVAITASSSPIASGPKAPPGGIDLNPALLDLQIKRDGNGVPLPLPLQPIETMHIDGFLPVIINITPISNLPMLLGLADTQPDTEEARPSFKAREIEPVSLLN